MVLNEGHVMLKLDSLVVADLRNPGLQVSELSRNQGVRYNLSSKQIRLTDWRYNLIFHDIYKKVDQLAQDSFNNLKDLKTIQDFIPDMRNALKKGEDYLNEKGMLYTILTKIFRFFGVTPIFGSHEQRLDDLEMKVKGRMVELENAIELKKKQVEDVTNRLLQDYNSEGSFYWAQMPLKENIQEEVFLMLSPAVKSFEGCGDWTIHVSIDPKQMQEALPIIIDVLYGPDAPCVGIKVACQGVLKDSHHIGKEVSLLFSDEAEKNPESVKTCLSLLWHRLYNARIRPEPGYVLTPETIETIENAPEGTQIKEKENLRAGMFSRRIPCPEGYDFFYYRNEHFNFIPVSTELAKSQPKFAHNPCKAPDPFLNLTLE